MRIFIDLTSLDDNFSGIERFTLNIALHMLEQHSEYQYILAFKNKVHPLFEKYKDRDGVCINVLKGKNKLFFNQIILSYYLLKIRADWYLFMAFPAPILFMNKHSVTAIHDIGCWDCPENGKNFSMLYFRLSYKKAVMNRKKIITVSKFTKKRIHDKLKVNQDNIVVVSNGISDVFLNYQEDTHMEEQILNKYHVDSRDYILCLSTVEPRKNMSLLINAYAELISEGKIEKKLLLVGRKGWKVDNILGHLAEKVKDLIYFTGFAPDEELPVLYRNAAYFVFPSVYEGFGIPPLEAMSMGTVVLSSDSTSLPEVLGDSAYYFKNNDLSSLKNKMLELNNNCSISNEIKQKMKINCNRYDWSVEADRLIEQLNEWEKKV